MECILCEACEIARSFSCSYKLCMILCANYGYHDMRKYRND